MPLPIRFLLGAASTFDFYVDSVNGSDVNNGRSASTPKQTLAGIGTLTANLRIGLARGGYWREQLSSGNNGLTVGDYGSGALPVIDGSDAVASNEWAPTTGMPNVYEISRTALSDTSGQHEVIWTSTAQAGVRAASLAACTAGTFFSGHTSGGAGTAYKMYLHPAGDTDPRINGIIYYMGSRLYCVDLPGSTVYNIQTRRQLHHDGSLRQTGAVSSARGCIAEEGVIHDAYTGGGTWANMIARNTEQGYSFVYNPGAVGTTLTATDLTANFVTPSTGPAFFIHGVNSARTDVRRMSIANSDNGIICADVKGTLLFSDTRYDKQSSSGNGRVFDFQNVSTSNAHDIFLIRPRAKALFLLYLNNLNAGSRVFIWEPIASLTWYSIYAQQCAELHVIGGMLGTTSKAFNITDGASRANVTLKHNAVRIASGETFVDFSGGTLTSNMNCFWDGGNGQTYRLNGSNIGIAAWRAAGYDVNSTCQTDLLLAGNPVTAANLADLDALIDENGKTILSSSASPLVTVGAGPGRVPANYAFPSWVPADVRALCGRA